MIGFLRFNVVGNRARGGRPGHGGPRENRHRFSGGLSGLLTLLRTLLRALLARHLRFQQLTRKPLPDEGMALLMLLKSVQMEFERAEDLKRFKQRVDAVRRKLLAAGWRDEMPTRGVPMSAWPALSSLLTTLLVHRHTLETRPKPGEDFRTRPPIHAGLVARYLIQAASRFAHACELEGLAAELEWERLGACWS